MLFSNKYGLEFLSSIFSLCFFVVVVVVVINSPSLIYLFILSFALSVSLVFCQFIFSLSSMLLECPTRRSFVLDVSITFSQLIFLFVLFV